mgnify:FL=1
MTNKKQCRVLITGFPNAGKSSLINILLKQKISIVSNKVQTTNENIQAVLSYKDCEIVFTDTPGVIDKKKFFDKKISREYSNNFEKIDLNLFVFDCTKNMSTSNKKRISELLKPHNVNFLVLNKTDLLEDNNLLPKIDSMNSDFDFKETFPVSIKKNIGLDKVLECILPYANKKRDRNIQILKKDTNYKVTEITREKIFNLLNKEIPYVVKIETNIQKLKNIMKITQIIIVKKESQKAIIIGKRGEKIKDVGTRARIDMEKFFKKKVFLDLKVLKK